MAMLVITRWYIYIFIPYGSFLGNVWGMISGVSRTFSGGVWILVGIYIYLFESKYYYSARIPLNYPYIPMCSMVVIPNFSEKPRWSQDKMSTADADELKNLVAELRRTISGCAVFFLGV
jgi:hypothetical protein